MTSVTRASWRAQRALVEAAVRSADFVAIDTELTGLSVKAADRYQLADTIDERYAKLVPAASFIGLPQYGIATFRWEPETHSYICHAFNVYLFPREQDVRFTCQSSSLEFLAQHKFDFNKWIYDGVNYADRKRSEYLKRKYSVAPTVTTAETDGSTTAAEQPRSNLIVPQGADAGFIQEILASVETWLNDGPSVPLDLPVCNGFRRRMIYEQVQAKYGVELTLDSIEAPGSTSLKSIRVSKLTTEDQNLHNARKQAESEEQLTSLLGFSVVIELISELRKPIVGHNMWLDMMHTLNKFIEPLPNNVVDFKNKLHAVFPTIFDTKHLFGATKVKNDGVGDTSLGELYTLFSDASLSSQPKIDLDECSKSYLEGETFHEAGFDAYTTGVVFARMLHMLAASKGHPTLTGKDLVQAPFVQEHANKIHNMRSLFSHVNLTGNDERINNGQHLVHVSGFSKDLKTAHFAALFNLPTADVKWIDDTSLLLVVPPGADVAALTEAARAQDPNIQVTSAEEFFERKASTRTALPPAPSPAGLLSPAPEAAAAASAEMEVATASTETTPTAPAKRARTS